MNKVIISALSSYLPESIVTNEELVEIYPRIELKPGLSIQNSPQEILKRCGIIERRSVRGSMNSSDMAVEAIKNLSIKAKLDLSQVDAIIVATCLPDNYFPSTAAVVLHKLGLRNCTGWDINAACSGFTYAMDLAKSKLRELGSRMRKIIVVSSDVVSKALDRYNYRTGILFGDASVAALVEVDNSDISGFQVNDTYHKVMIDHIGDVYLATPFGLPEGVNWFDDKEPFKLDGAGVYVQGVKFTCEFVEQYCREFHVSMDEVDYFIPHQANERMITKLRKKLGLGDRLLSNIQNVGNTVASSVPLCLHEFNEKGIFKKGDRIMMCSFGAGYTLCMVDVVVK